MKNTRKLIPAIAMLLVSAVMMSTASFAWFTMNSTVKADSISMTAVAPASLWIAQNENTPAWDSTVTLVNENTSYTGAYVPVHPADGTVDFKTVADPSSVPITGVVPEGTAMVASDSYYMDTILLKLDGEAGASTGVKVKAAISYTGADDADEIWNAIRVAFVVDDVYSTMLQFTTLNSNPGDGALTYTASEDLATLVAAAEDPTEVKVYAWIDGEDASCINENAFNKHTFSISLVFELDNGSN